MPAVLALLSSLLWGSGDFVAGWLSRSRSAFAVAGFAQIVGLLLIAVVVLVSGAWQVGLGPYVFWGALGSVAGLGGLILLYLALATGHMGVVSPIAALGVLVPLTVAFLQGETPSRVQFLGILLAVVGVVLASGPEVSGAAGARPVLLAIGAATGFGFFYVVMDQGAATSPVMTLFVQRVVASLLVLGAVAMVRSSGGLTRGDAPWIVLVGALDVGANLTLVLALETGLLAVVSVLASLYPLVTVVLAWAILKERLAPVQYAGAAIVLIGVIAINLP
jgi:drug/metabolite transporter (DMT)-like permease